LRDTDNLVVADKSFRLEFLWLGVDFGIHVDSPSVGDDSSASWDEVAFVNIVCGGSVCETTSDNWSPSLDFLYHGRDVNEVRLIFKCRHAVSTNNSVDFFLCETLLFGVVYHGHDEGGDSI
jgi:hypothetical protein